MSKSSILQETYSYPREMNFACPTISYLFAELSPTELKHLRSIPTWVTLFLLFNSPERLDIDLRMYNRQQDSRDMFCLPPLSRQ